MIDPLCRLAVDRDIVVADGYIRSMIRPLVALSVFGSLNIGAMHAPAINMAKVYPWVKPDLSEQTLEPSTPYTGDFITGKLMGDLFLLYVEDKGDSFSVLFNKDLPAGMSSEQFHAMSVKNLRRDIAFTLKEPAPGCSMIIAGGDHEAGALCLPELWVKWSAERKDDLVVAPLSKDVVLFAAAHDADAQDVMAQLIKRMDGKLERLLTKKRFLYTVKGAKWSVME